MTSCRLWDPGDTYIVVYLLFFSSECLHPLNVCVYTGIVTLHFYCLCKTGSCINDNHLNRFHDS